uniref:MRN complex-interacting protein N-terminal domain-containing protein n=1 Tax=Dicentrarchus labrax TaxID=13489 RepID=A0A8C4DR63_DICLA
MVTGSCSGRLLWSDLRSTSHWASGLCDASFPCLFLFPIWPSSILPPQLLVGLACCYFVKKANRWSCKLCGEKQSLLKEFGRGSGADCRRHVQKLNAMRGVVMEEQEHNTWSLW